MDSSEAPDGTPGYGPPPVILALQRTRPAQTHEGWFREPPFQRIVDLELIFPGFPDVLGGCVEITPTIFFTLEGCGSTILLASSAFLHLKSRFLHYGAFKAPEEGDWSGWEISFGPGLGARLFGVMANEVAVRRSGGSAFAVFPTIDAFLSLEVVYWFSSDVGFSVQLDAGAVVFMIPMGRASFGVTFAIPRPPAPTP